MVGGLNGGVGLIGFVAQGGLGCSVFKLKSGFGVMVFMPMTRIFSPLCREKEMEIKAKVL